VCVSLKSGYWTPDSPFAGGLYRNAKETTINTWAEHDQGHSAGRRSIKGKPGTSRKCLQDFRQGIFMLGVSSPFQQMFPQSIIQFKFIDCAVGGKEIL